MADYGNETTPLTASRYAWTATITRGPLRYGRNASRDCSGTYGTQPGQTVRDLLADIRTWYAQSYHVPADAVVLVSYSLREL